MPRKSSPKNSPLRQSPRKQAKQPTKQKQATTNVNNNNSDKITRSKKQPFSNKINKSPKSDAVTSKANDTPTKNQTFTDKKKNTKQSCVELENNATKTDTKAPKSKTSPKELKVERPKKKFKLEGLKQSPAEKVEANNSPKGKKRKLPVQNNDSKELSPDKSNIGTSKTKVKLKDQKPASAKTQNTIKESPTRKRKLPIQNSDIKDSPSKKAKKPSARRKRDVKTPNDSELKSLPKLDLDVTDEARIDNKDVLTENTCKSPKIKNEDSKQKRSPKKNTSPFKKTAKLIALSESIESPKKGRTKSPNKRSTVRKKAAQKEQNRDIFDDEDLLYNKTLEDVDTGDVGDKVSRLEGEYIADGFKDDCELFIHKCQSVSRLNYQKFREVWLEMDFAHIYQGRQTGSEIAELSEEVIHVAKSYMIAKDRHFEVNVAGLFLVYTLLHFQPYENFAPLKLVPEDIPAIKALESEARKQRRHDVLYILGSVLRKGPCHFHVAERERALDHYLKKYFDGTVQVSDASTQPVGVIGNNMEALSLIKMLTTLDHKYSDAKQKLQQQSGPDRSLSYSQFTADELQQSILQLVPKYLSETVNITSTSPTKVQSYEEERQSTMKSIKNKAMANTVNPIRHLTGIEERINKSLTPPTPTIGDKSKTSLTGKTQNESNEETEMNKEWSPKILRRLFKMKSNQKNISKNSSPKKVTITPDSSQKKASEVTTPKSERKTKHEVRIDFSAESDELDDHDTKYDSDEADPLATPTIGKSLPVLENLMSMCETNDMQMSPEVNDHTNVRVTTLPLEIQGADNQEIEVRIIDYYDQESDDEIPVNTESEIKILSIEDVTPINIKSKQNVANSVNSESVSIISGQDVKYSANLEMEPRSSETESGNQCETLNKSLDNLEDSENLEKEPKYIENKNLEITSDCLEDSGDLEKEAKYSEKIKGVVLGMNLKT